MPTTAPPRRGLIVSLIVVLVLSFGSLFATLTAGWSPRLGLDLAGGLSVVFEPAHPVSTSELNVAAAILSERVNGLGVSGAQVNLQGTDIAVSVPGVTDARQILEQIGSTGQLNFRPVICEANAATKGSKIVTPLPACSADYQMTETNLDVTPNANVTGGFTSNTPPVSPQYNDIRSNNSENDPAGQTVLLPLLGSPTIRLLCGKTQLPGTAVASAQAVVGTLGDWQVNYTLTGSGSPAWDDVAKANFHQLIAIDLDGVVQSDPIIQPTQGSFTSFAGSGTITGNFGEGPAKALALDLNYGALPVSLKELYVDTISPTLGHSALVAGLGAGLVGLGLVLLYAIVYYRALGLVIVLGLTVTAGLLWSIISALGHTSVAPSFDLSGVTGLIVSIGITVDSYIVYFERLKDETRHGRTVRTSVDRGFRSAWRTVLAADFVSLLAAVLLYWIAVGTVRGFAFFLGLSTIMDVAITWYFTRPLVMLLGRRAGVASTSALSIAAGMGAGGARADVAPDPVGAASD
jgi:preprotein translocase subunit SecD